MKRFFIEMKLGGEIVLQDGEHHHLCNVLRMRVGDEIIIVCGDEFDYLYKIEKITKTTSTLRFISKKKNEQNPSVQTDVYLASIKPDALHTAVTGLNEIGVSDLYIFASEFSLKTANIEKLNNIAKQSCKQCGRSIPLRVHGVIDFKEIPANSEIVIGPEGGFSENEKKHLSRIGINTRMYLGKRILRAETAALAAATLMMKEREGWSR